MTHSIFGMMLNEQFALNEAVKNITNGSSSGKSLIVQIDLSKLEEDTLDSLWNDYGIDWKKLDRSELQKLYKLLKVTDLEFEEWFEENGF